MWWPQIMIVVGAIGTILAFVLVWSGWESCPPPENYDLEHGAFPS